MSTCPEPNSVSEAARGIGANLIALACTRAELIAIELAEHRAQAKRELVLGLIAAVFLAMGLMLLAMLWVLYFWETWRVPAAALVTALYLTIGGLALVRLARWQGTHAAPFALTMSEFARDLKALYGHGHD